MGLVFPSFISSQSSLSGVYNLDWFFMLLHVIKLSLVHAKCTFKLSQKFWFSLLMQGAFYSEKTKDVFMLTFKGS